MRLVGLLGGTFDPVHCGHLRLAIETRECCALDEVVMLPAGQPRLRGRPSATPEVRLALLEIAVHDIPGLRVDARELHRPGPTVTADTLAILRAEHPSDSLCLIVGSDAFAHLARWTRWQQIPSLCHIVVARRPGSALPRRGAVAALLRERLTDDTHRLRETPAGRIVVAEVPALDISATRVRELLAAGRSARFLVPDHVLLHILDNGFYGNA